MVLRAATLYPLTAFGEPLPPLDTAARLSLKWPRWYPPTALESQQDATTVTTLVQAGLLSRETALRSVADLYGVDSVAAELALIGPSQVADDAAQ